MPRAWIILDERYGETYVTGKKKWYRKVWRKSSEKHENARKEKNPPIISKKTGFPPFLCIPRLDAHAMDMELLWVY